MVDKLLDLLGDPRLWKYASIPFVAALVGWATNWVAVRLTFLPIEFVGLWPPLGWQGIIPSKARKMAATFVDSTMSRLGSLGEVFEAMDPRAVAAQVVRVLEPRMDEYTDEVLRRHHPVLWGNLPSVVKRQIYAAARGRLREVVHGLMAEVGDNVEELVDLDHLVVERLTSDKALLNRLFLESGREEFRFIVRSGAGFGFLFGLVQLAVWVVWPRWWVLPLFGLAVGWATNWIALNLIFRPLEPTRVGPWTVQGLFLRRQKEVAAVWCRIVTREILTLSRLVHSMLEGPRGERSRELLRRHSRPIVDEAVGLVKPLAQVTVGLGGFDEIRESVGEKAVDGSTEPFDDPLFEENRAQVVERLLRERMEALPPAEFQDLLRPCFQEDEMKLVVLGGVLGLAAGLAQLFLLFGGVG